MSMEVDKNKQDEVLSNTDQYFKDDEITVEEDLRETEILNDAFIFEVSKDDIFQDAVTLQYLETKDIAKVPDVQRARVQKRAQKYFYKGGKIFKTSKTKAEAIEIPPPDSRSSLVHKMHCNCSHIEVNRLMELISRKYYWTGMFRQIQAVVSHCKQCKNARPKFEQLGKMFPVPIYSAFHTVGVDIIGPFPKVGPGWKYVLVAIDYCTKWPEAKPLMDVTAEEVRHAFFRMIIAGHGAPRRVISDGGGSFKGSFDEMLKEWNTQHRTTAAYHHVWTT